VTVLGSGVDPDGDQFTWEWTQLEGPQVALSGADTDTVTFTAPDTTNPVVVKLQLVVRDATLASEPAIVDVVVKNPNRPYDMTKMGCGCTSGLELLPFAALGLLFRARRRR
jgi:uncharacterized protein (TIGR03382 family)